MNMLQAYQREPSRVLKNVDRWTCVGKVEGHGWICTHGDGLYAVNFQRLYEIILYSRMLNQHHLPSVSRSDPIVLNERLRIHKLVNLELSMIQLVILQVFGKLSIVGLAY